MPQYRAPLKDFAFLLNHYLPLSHYTDVPGFALAQEMMEPVLQEAAKLCEEVLFPLNQPGDQQGCRWQEGRVKTPEGFPEAYRLYREGGWSAITCEEAYGGQGLPEWLNMGVVEMICSANLSFGITPGLSHGFYQALSLHGTDAQKQTYLPKLASGEWSGVMCLTESHCGTDLGLIRTQAVPVGDGTYRVTGNKIFISSGEQDLTENILHLVLAKLPDAPEGVKGISLFLVPKMLVKNDGTLGERNAVQCLSIEHKMGIKASPTCVMEYDGAVGYLVGEPHKGLRAMFTMMNAARLYVGVQGLGLAEVAYQNALAYAQERVQGRALKGAMAKDKPADPIIVHPDVRLNLMKMQAFTEGARALALEVAMHLDIAQHHPDATQRQASDDLVQLLTPIVKAYFTDMGYEVTNAAMQIYGGHGYIAEYGIEQYARDARIAQIYEGANGIQAMDLVGRKLGVDYGRYLRQVFHPMDAWVKEHAAHPQLGGLAKGLKKGMGWLQQASLWIAMKGLGNPEEAGAGASDYLRMFGVVMLGFVWCKQARAALDALQAGQGDAEMLQEKLRTAEFMLARVVPTVAGNLASLTQGVKPLHMHMPLGSAHGA